MVHVMELAGKDFKIAMTTVFNKIEEKTNRRDLKTGVLTEKGALENKSHGSSVC